MSDVEQRAGALDNYFDSARAGRGDVRREGSLMTDYSEEARRATAVTNEQLALIDARPDMLERDKFMARMALRDSMQTDGDIDSQRGLLRSGMIIIDRVYSGFQDGSPVVARVEKEGVALYPSRGINDLRISDERVSSGSSGRERWLSVQYENGVRVEANPMLDDMIHTNIEPDSERIISALNGKNGVHGKDPFHRLRKWDPAHPEYDPTFVRLGTPTQPVDTGRLVVTDSQRFAFRAASDLMGHSDWLTTDRPSDVFREKLIKEFAYAYWDLLAFGEPIDGQTRQILHQSSSGKVGIEHRRNRKKSLVDYSTRERSAIHYGADIVVDDLIMATQEIIDRKDRKANTMRKEYRVMRARRDFNALFRGTDR